MKEEDQGHDLEVQGTTETDIGMEIAREEGIGEGKVDLQVEEGITQETDMVVAMWKKPHLQLQL